MTWYKNYLSSQTQPWARQVQKKLDNLESTFRSAEVNNTTRDDQLASSLRQVQSAATQASEASIEASSAAQAAADAAQAAADANALAITANTNAIDAAQDAADAAQAAADANTLAIDANALAIDANTLADSAQDDAIFALQRIVNLGSPGGPTINASNITAGILNAITINNTTFTGGTINGTNIFCQFVESVGEVSTPFVNAGIVFANQSFQGTVNTTIASNTTSSFAGNVFINTSGNMFRSTFSSSREAKENIEEYVFDTDAFISVKPVTFNYKADAVSDPEETQVKQLGFILEDFEAAGAGEFLTIPTNEMDKYKGLRYDKLYMMLHKVVQEQQATIKELNARITTLEAKV